MKYWAATCLHGDRDQPFSPLQVKGIWRHIQEDLLTRAHRCHLPLRRALTARLWWVASPARGSSGRLYQPCASWGTEESRELFRWLSALWKRNWSWYHPWHPRTPSHPYVVSAILNERPLNAKFIARTVQAVTPNMLLSGRTAGNRSSDPELLPLLPPKPP